MKGRPRDPTRARRRTGHRAKPGEEKPGIAIVRAGEEDPRARLLTAPEDLPEAMVPTWDRIQDLLATVTTPHPADAIVLEELVRQYHRAKQCGAIIDKYGVVTRTVSGDVIPSKFLDEERKAAAMVLRLSEHFGLTFAARLRLGLMQLQGRTLAEALNADLNE